MIYLDGTALCRFLPGVRYGEAWEAWVVDHESELVTSPLGLTELRQAAALYPREQLAEVTAVVERVRQLVPQVRFSDDNVTISSHATAVLKPFAALHIGAAVGADRVDQIATCDPSVAHVAEIYRLKVVTPGLETGWYLTFEGPTESWKPIALDAPYDPGAEFAIPALEPIPDPYAEALREVEAIDATHGEHVDDAGDDREPGATPEPEASEALVTDSPEAEAEAEAAEEPALEPGAVRREPTPDADSDEPGDLPEVATDAAPPVEADVATAGDAATTGEAVTMGDAAPVEELPPAMEFTLEPASVVEPVRVRLPDQAPSGAASVAPPAVAPPAAGESDASRRRAEMIARLGQYQPKVVAWQGDGEAPAASPAGSPAGASTPQPSTSFGESPVEAPTVTTPAVPIDVSAADAGPRERTPIESAVDSLAIPIGEPVRRPMLRQASSPRPVAEDGGAEPEEFAPTLPALSLNVEIEEPTSYAPERFEASASFGASHPFSRAGQTAAMAAEPPGTSEIPTLEPIASDDEGLGLEEAVVAEPAPPIEAEAPKASGGRWRLGKGKGKEKGVKGQPSPSESAEVVDDDPGWRMEDILGPGGGRG